MLSLQGGQTSTCVKQVKCELWESERFAAAPLIKVNQTGGGVNLLQNKNFTHLVFFLRSWFTSRPDQILLGLLQSVSRLSAWLFGVFWYVYQLFYNTNYVFSSYFYGSGSDRWCVSVWDPLVANVGFKATLFECYATTPSLWYELLRRITTWEEVQPRGRFHLVVLLLSDSFMALTMLDSFLWPVPVCVQSLTETLTIRPTRWTVSFTEVKAIVWRCGKYVYLIYSGVSLA